MLNERMYVEYYAYDSTGSNQRRIGQWILEKNGNATIYYHVAEQRDHIVSHPISIPSVLIKRADIKAGTIGLYNNKLVTIIRKSGKTGENGYSFYYCLIQGKAGSVLI